MDTEVEVQLKAILSNPVNAHVSIWRTDPRPPSHIPAAGWGVGIESRLLGEPTHIHFGETLLDALKLCAIDVFDNPPAY